MNTNYVIQTTGLEYFHQKPNKTLSNINLRIAKGEIYGFLGPNGAGKTTTLRLLLGLLPMQVGKIEIFGQDFKSNRISILKRIGSLIEAPSLYGHLQARENLNVYREIYGATKTRVDEVLEIVGLENTRNKKVKQFSLGMKQRLSIALALLPNPDLLILDEPSNGLDPTGIIELRALIKKLNKEQGMTIIMSSHQLAEIEKIVSHVGIIAKGELLFQGSLEELKNVQKKQSKLLVRTSNDKVAQSLLKNYLPKPIDGVLEVSYQDDNDIAGIGKLLYDHNLKIYLLQPQEQNLEQLFIDLTTESA